MNNKRAKSPVRKSKTKSPVRKSKTKSPIRKYKSKSPVRKSPIRKSPIRKSKTKSPVRKSKTKSTIRKSTIRKSKTKLRGGGKEEEEKEEKEKFEYKPIVWKDPSSSSTTARGASLSTAPSSRIGLSTSKGPLSSTIRGPTISKSSSPIKHTIPSSSTTASFSPLKSESISKSHFDSSRSSSFVSRSATASYIKAHSAISCLENYNHRSKTDGFSEMTISEHNLYIQYYKYFYLFPTVEIVTKNDIVTQLLICIISRYNNYLYSSYDIRTRNIKTNETSFQHKVMIFFSILIYMKHIRDLVLNETDKDLIINNFKNRLINLGIEKGYSNDWYFRNIEPMLNKIFNFSNLDNTNIEKEYNFDYYFRLSPLPQSFSTTEKIEYDRLYKNRINFMKRNYKVNEDYIKLYQENFEFYAKYN